MQWNEPRVVSVSAFVPPPFAEMMQKHRLMPTATEGLYNNHVTHFQGTPDVDFNRITYKSGELNITGAMLTPKQMKAGAHPVIIYNRGGSGEFGVINVFMLNLLAEYARAGYVVLGSNYRGNDGSDGKDEFGGTDVQDVLELLDIARTHPAWDGKNIFMYGHSRGAMMTFLAIRQGAMLNAAAAVAGPTHCDDLLTERPDMIKVYRRMIPGYDANPQTTMQERSAVYWADKLDTPLLILHGDADDRVHISHAHAIDAALTKAGKTHKTIIYPGGDHSFMRRYRTESIQEILAWFAQYKR